MASRSPVRMLGTVKLLMLYELNRLAGRVTDWKQVPQV
jgi:hypothetical protein